MPDKNFTKHLDLFKQWFIYDYWPQAKNAPHRFWTDLEKEHILALYNNGWKVKRIADLYSDGNIAKIHGVLYRAKK